MNTLPKMASISELRHNHLDVFAQLAGGPVVIANRNQPTAVLVSPEQWDAIAEELEDLRDTIAGLEALLRLERGEEGTAELAPELLTAWAAGDAVAT